MISSEHLLWLTACVYFEARGENTDGQKAVVHVILNRSFLRGKTIKDIITAPFQFSWYNQVSVEKKGFPHIKDWVSFVKCVESVELACRERQDGSNLKGADHYFNPKVVLPSWAKGMTLIARIGNHDFYKS